MGDAAAAVAAAEHVADCGGDVTGGVAGVAGRGGGGGDDVGRRGVEQAKNFGEWHAPHVLTVDVGKKVPRLQGCLRSFGGQMGRKSRTAGNEAMPSTALCPGDDLGAQLKIWTAVGLAHTFLFTRIKTDDFSIHGVRQHSYCVYLRENSNKETCRPCIYHSNDEPTALRNSLAMVV